MTRHEASVFAVLALCAVSAGLGFALRADDPPMGRWEVIPRELVSGEQTAIRLRYVNGTAALPPGSAFSMEVEPISVVQLQGGPASVGLDADPAEHDQPAARVTVVGAGVRGAVVLRVQFPNGVPAGRTVTLRYGNKQLDGKMPALVNPVPVHDLAWNVVYHPSPDDTAGVSWVERGWWRELPRVDIKPAPASAVRITVPSAVGVGHPFRVRVAVTDRFESRPDPPYVGVVRLKVPDGLTGLPEQIRFAEADASSRVIDGVRAMKPGVYRIGAASLSETDGAMAIESNPIVVQSGVSTPIYWGVLHGLAGYTAGWGDGADSYYRYAREIAGLDYAALSEELPAADRAAEWHPDGIYACRYGRSLSAADVQREVLEAARKHLRAGEFITVPGYLGATASAGSHGVYTADASAEGLGRVLPHTAATFPFELYDQMKASDPLVIHHLNAGYVPYGYLSGGLTHSGATLAPVLECYSDWGMAFPGPGPFSPLVGGVRSRVAKSLFRVIGRGLRFGLVGDSGTLTGWPARRYPASVGQRQKFVQGLTAVQALNLTRAGILEAYRSRRVYATTGERIVLTFTINAVGMGGTVLSDKPLTAVVEAHGTAGISEVSLFNGDRVLSQARFANRPDVRAAFDLAAPVPEDTPYLVEVVQMDGHRAWSSPIWARKRTAPELKWERGSDGKLYLRNAGTAPALKVALRGHRSGYGFVRPGWPAAAALSKEADGQVWLKRWSDRRATLFVSWRGSKLNGSMRLTGQTAYDPEPDYALLANGGTFRDDGSGTITFADAVETGRGFCVNLTVVPSQQCTVSLTFSRELALRMGGDIRKGTEFRIPINQYAAGNAASSIVIPALAPGARYAVPNADWCWMADPGNTIAETDEGNNLWTPGRRTGLR
jgi:hypothetical protein